MKKLTKSQKLNIFLIICIVLTSIYEFIQKNYILGFIFLMLTLNFFFLDDSKKKKK